MGHGDHRRRHTAGAAPRMTKALSIVIVLIMVVQIIKPLGLPGLRKRSDFWKLALVALGLLSLTVVLSHGS
jgi:hypothetical protein